MENCLHKPGFGQVSALPGREMIGLVWKKWTIMDA
jgi:hypothetical protein